MNQIIQDNLQFKNIIIRYYYLIQILIIKPYNI